MTGSSLLLWGREEGKSGPLTILNLPGVQESKHRKAPTRPEESTWLSILDLEPPLPKQAGLAVGKGAPRAQDGPQTLSAPKLPTGVEERPSSGHRLHC